MNMSFWRLPALAIILAAGLQEADNANRVLAQQFSGSIATERADQQLPPPERPDDDGGQQVDGRARQESDTEQQLDTGTDFDVRREFDRRQEFNVGQQFDGEEQIDAGQHVDSARPYLGITFDSEFPEAAVARSVVPGSPAEQAGIQPGDTIDAINDRRVSSYQDAYEIVEAMRPGEIIDIDFSRRLSGRTQAVIGRRPLEDLQTVDYAPEVTGRGTLNRANGSTGYAPLPPPPRFEDRSRPLPDYSNGVYPEQSYEPRPDIRREEPRQDDRLRDRVRPGERGFRNRPLLPWRRN